MRFIHYNLQCEDVSTIGKIIFLFLVQIDGHTSSWLSDGFSRRACSEKYTLNFLYLTRICIFGTTPTIQRHKWVTHLLTSTCSLLFAAFYFESHLFEPSVFPITNKIFRSLVAYVHASWRLCSHNYPQSVRWWNAWVFFCLLIDSPFLIPFISLQCFVLRSCCHDCTYKIPPPITQCT